MKGQSIAEFKKSVRLIEFKCGCIILKGNYEFICKRHHACLAKGDSWL